MPKKPTYEELEQRVRELETAESERKRIEEELRYSEKRYRDLFDSNLDGIAESDLEGNIIVCNQAYLEMTSHTLEEMKQLRYQDLTPERWREVDEVHVKQALERGYSEIYEKERKRKDGTVFPISIRIWTRKNGHGEPIGLWGIVRDISERKRAENMLRESEERHRILSDEAPVGISLISEDGQYRYINPKFTEIFGYTLDDIATGRDWFWKAFPDSDYRNEVIATWVGDKEKFKVGETRPRVYIVRCKDGSDKEIHFRPVMLNSGQQLVLYEDITDRKHAEEALRESEKRFRTLFETSPQALALTDIKAGRVLDVNDTFCRLSKYSKNELVGKTTLELGFYSQDDRNRFIHELTKKGKVNGIEVDFKISDGSILNSRVFAVPIKIDGKSSILTSFFDMREQNRLEAQLRQAQKMESVGRLAGGVAHDFNNMLSVILGNTEMAMELVALDQPLHANLQEIKTAAQRSADVTRQLLAFARKQTIAPKVLDLNKTVKSMLKMLRRLIGEDIDLVWLPGENLWPVRVDPPQIDQILANLCVNARDAITGGGNLTIETGKVTFDEGYCSDHQGFVPGDFVKLTVSDNGCGMDTETLKSVFEPFYTTKGKERGTGLGLATVYGIVKQNGGFINVYSEPNQGTSFKIYLPRHAAAGEQVREKDRAEQVSQGSETILLVEDEKAILTVTAMILKRLGYNLLTATTPGEAINLAREYDGDIHLLMTDVVMPEMNGRDLAKNLLSIYPNVKRLFMSGYTANVVTHHGILDEGVNFIQKPFSKKDLSDKVREVLVDESEG